MTNESRGSLTPEQLADFRGPMRGGRMLTAEEARLVLDAYEFQHEVRDMICMEGEAFRRKIAKALDGESANDSYTGAIRCLRRERDDLRAKLASCVEVLETFDRECACDTAHHRHVVHEALAAAKGGS
jgi:hypothetical protein